MQLAYVSAARIRRPTHASMNSAVQHFLQEAPRAISKCTIFVSKPLFPLSRELRNLAAARNQWNCKGSWRHSRNTAQLGRGPYHTKHTFEKAQVRSLKEAVKLTALLHEPCSPVLASIHTGGDSVTFSEPEESMWPVIQIMLSQKIA